MFRAPESCIGAAFLIQHPQDVSLDFWPPTFASFNKSMEPWYEGSVRRVERDAKGKPDIYILRNGHE
jgi:hypothetical protein